MKKNIKSPIQIYEKIRKCNDRIEKTILCHELFTLALVENNKKAKDLFVLFFRGLIIRWTKEIRADMSDENIYESSTLVILNLFKLNKENIFKYKSPGELTLYLKNSLPFCLNSNAQVKKVKREIIAYLKDNISYLKDELLNYSNRFKVGQCKYKDLDSTYSSNPILHIIIFDSSLKGIKLVETFNNIVKHAEFSSITYKQVFNVQQTLIWNFYKFIRCQRPKSFKRKFLIDRLLSNTYKVVEVKENIYINPNDPYSFLQIEESINNEIDFNLQIALLSLSEVEQKLIRMRYVENMTLGEIAESENISEYKINKLLDSTLEKLKLKYETIKSI